MPHFVHSAFPTNAHREGVGCSTKWGRGGLHCALWRFASTWRKFWEEMREHEESKEKVCALTGKARGECPVWAIWARGECSVFAFSVDQKIYIYISRELVKWWASIWSKESRRCNGRPCIENISFFEASLLVRTCAFLTPWQEEDNSDAKRCSNSKTWIDERQQDLQHGDVMHYHQSLCFPHTSYTFDQTEGGFDVVKALATRIWSDRRGLEVLRLFLCGTITHPTGIAFVHSSVSIASGSHVSHLYCGRYSSKTCCLVLDFFIFPEVSWDAGEHLDCHFAQSGSLRFPEEEPKKTRHQPSALTQICIAAGSCLSSRQNKRSRLSETGP